MEKRKLAKLSAAARGKDRPLSGGHERHVRT
jgi:hypothetical protein